MSDEHLRELERVALTDPEARERLKRAQARAGLSPVGTLERRWLVGNIPHRRRVVVPLRHLVRPSLGAIRGALTGDVEVATCCGRSVGRGTLTWVALARANEQEPLARPGERLTNGCRSCQATLGDWLRCPWETMGAKPSRIQWCWMQQVAIAEGLRFPLDHVSVPSWSPVTGDPIDAGRDVLAGRIRSALIVVVNEIRNSVACVPAVEAAMRRRGWPV